MKRFRLLGMASLAVFAISIVASATASAANPEFLGSATLKGTAVGNSILQTLAGTKVECTGGTSGGTITDKTKTVTKVAITFTGCKSSGFACESTDKPGKEIIKTHELTGTLVYITKSPLDVGVLFQPTKAGDFFVEFNCAGGIVKVLVLGKVICLITPPNSKTTKYELKCGQENGDQIIKLIEGGTENEVLKTSINGGTEESSGETATAKIETSVAVEIMA